MVALFQLLYSLWPVIFTFFLIPWPPLHGDQTLRTRLQSRLILVWSAWLLWLFFLILLRIYQINPLGFIPEPLNTVLFLCFGGLLTAGFFGPRVMQFLDAQQNLLTAENIESLRLLSPDEFEELIAAYFRQYGYRVRHTGRSGDHGVDLVVYTPENGKWIVQCKRWKGSVGEPIVRDLYGSMFHEAASKAFLMTTGSFTPAAEAWAKGKPITLYDGAGLVKLFKRVQKHD